MRNKLHENMGVPPEFHEDGAPEYTALPDEFNRFAPIVEPTEERSRIRKVMLYLASAGLITLGFFVPRSDSAAQTVKPTVPAASAVVEVSETPVATAQPTIVSTPAPTPAPTPIPTETPKVTPIPTPGVNVVYYRMSEVYYADLVVMAPEQVSSVSLRLTAPNVDEPAFTAELSEQQIADRFYKLRAEDRDEGFDASRYLFEHGEEFAGLDGDPDLTLELTYTCTTDAGEQTYTETYAPDEELWVYWRYDSEDEVGGITEMMFGDLFPNCFTVRLFESEDPDQQLLVGDDAEALNNGGISITVSIDGREIPAEYGKLYKAMYRYEGDETIYYDYVLVISVPEDFPQHGEATMTLYRKLIHSGSVLIRVKTVEY